MNKIISLVLVILLISRCFSYTIENKYREKIKNCNLKYTQNYKLFYEVEGERESINCSFIRKIYDDNNDELKLSCSEERLLIHEIKKEKNTQIKLSKHHKTFFIGMFAGVAGATIFFIILLDSIAGIGAYG